VIVETLCDEHGLPVPATVTAYHARLTGQYVARCELCGVVFAAWECSCEWSHDCGGEL